MRNILLLSFDSSPEDTSQSLKQILRMTASCNPGVTADFEALLDFREYLKELFKIQEVSLLSLALVKYLGKSSTAATCPVAS